MLITALKAMSFVATAFFLFQLVSAAVYHLTRVRGMRLGREFTSLISPKPVVTAVVPAYNEHPSTLYRCIRQLLDSVGVLVEVIVIDDGSTVPIDVSSFPGVRLIRLDKRQGKRHAQVAGVKVANAPWIATIDSDTFVEPEALLHLMNAALIQEADAVSGTAVLSNQEKNLLTKVTSLFYWFAYYLERASQSLYGHVMVCSGAISLYRASAVAALIPEYVSQTLFGRPVEAGDDRYLTMLMRLAGHKVIWTPFARAATVMPETLADFIRQQVRWNRSFYATIPAAVKRIHHWTDWFAYFLVRHLFRLPYNALVLTTAIVLSVHAHSCWPIAWMFLCVFVVALIKGLIAFALVPNERRDKRDWRFIYLLPVIAVPSLVLMTGVMIYAALTPTKAKWTSRLTEATTQ